MKIWIKMAFRNIKNYKKHYLVVFVMMLMISTFMFCRVMIAEQAIDPLNVYEIEWTRLQMLYQNLVMLSIFMGVLVSTSMKRRKKEATMLRSLGATAGQLILMVSIENMVVITCALVISIAFSLIITLKQTGLLYSDYAWLCFYGLIILVWTFFMTFLPMRKSVMNALVGAFEAPIPKMLQGRQSKWIHQSKYVMAKRQLSAYSGITKTLLVSSLLLSIYVATYYAEISSNKELYDISVLKQYHHTQSFFDNPADLDEYLACFDETAKHYVLESKPILVNEFYEDIVCYDEDFFQNVSLCRGRIPEANDEVMINSNHLQEKRKIDMIENNIVIDVNSDQLLVVETENGEVFLTVFTIDENNNVLGYEGANWSHYLNYNGPHFYLDNQLFDVKDQQLILYSGPTLNETITVNGDEYKIVGIYDEGFSHIDIEGSTFELDMWHNNLFHTDNIVVTKEVFDQLPGNINYHSFTIFNKDQARKIGSQLLETQDFFSHHSLTEFVSNKDTVIDVTSYDMSFVLTMIVLVIGICTILLLNNCVNDIKNYASLHLLGMCKSDLLMLHIWMGFVMAIRTIIFLSIYLFFLYVGFSYLVPIHILTLIVLGNIIGYQFIFILPACAILNHSLLDYLGNEV